MAREEHALSRREPGFGRFEPWNPFRELLAMDRGRWLDDLLGERRLAPVLPIDVTETDGKYRVSVEVPGVDKKDIQIECSDGMLSITAEKKSQRDEKEGSARILERSYGVFTRSIALPDDADLDRVDASFKDGVLRIDVPQKPSAAPKKVQIRD